VRFLRSLRWSFLFSLVCGLGAADTTPLRVGVVEFPPFTIKTTDGWKGLSIDLWEAVAHQHGWSFVYEEAKAAQILDVLATGAMQVCVTPLPLTIDVERRIDFSHSYYSSGYGIAVLKKPRGAGWGAILRELIAARSFALVGATIAAMVVAGWVLWLCERKQNSRQFASSPRDGLLSGVWWAAVTMTTVGYGDKVPVTAPERLFAMFWLFAGVILSSSITAHITSSLTLHQIRSTITKPEDLHQHRLGVLCGTSAEEFLRENRMKFRCYTTEPKARAALAGGDVEAIVAPAPLLKYTLLQEMNANWEILPFTVGSMDFAFGLPERSALREPLNQTVLEILASREWQAIRDRYLEESR